jgi:hypothetical protein
MRSGVGRFVCQRSEDPNSSGWNRRSISAIMARPEPACQKITLRRYARLRRSRTADYRLSSGPSGLARFSPCKLRGIWRKSAQLAFVSDHNPPR